MRFYNKNKEYLGWSTLTGSGRNLYINIGTQVTATDLTPKYFKFRQTLSAGPITSLDDNVMITKVNDMNYEPFGNIYNVDLPVENLLPNATTSSTIQGVEYTINSDKSINVVGTATSSNSDFYIVGDSSTYASLGLQGGTYNLSGCVSGSNTTYMLYMVKKSSDNTLSYHISTGAKGLSINISNGDTFRIFIRVIANTNVNVTIYPQLEKGSEANSYTPYGTTPIELCKIGNYQDYIYKDSGKWYLHKVIGKYNIDTSTLGIKTNYTNIEYATIPKPNDYLGYGSFDRVEIICKSASHIAQAPSGWNDANLVNKISGNPEANRWWLGFSKGTGITAIQNALNGSYIYYPLTTPTNTEITDTTLISQLNALELATSKENQTNINQINNDLPFIISAEAILSLKNVLDRIELLES